MSESQRAYSAPPLSPADETLWSTLAHIGNVIGCLPSLLILLILGPRSPRVRQESPVARKSVAGEMGTAAFGSGRPRCFSASSSASVRLPPAESPATKRLRAGTAPLGPFSRSQR